MSNDTRGFELLGAPVTWLRATVGQAWRDLLSIYYTNTPVWRWLKSGTLVFFGFFLWTGSSMILSVQPDWWILRYSAAYGIVLILWGPLTHMLVVPLAIRLRRTAQHPVTRAFARQGSKINLSVFLVIVLVLGTFPVGPTVLDFGSGIPLTGDDSEEVSATLSCEADEETITCLLEADSERVDHVVVRSGGEEIARVDERPFETQFAIDDVQEVVGQKEFVIEARSADGETLARFVRTVTGVR